MIRLSKIFSLFSAVLLIAGCATPNAQYKFEDNNQNPLPNKEIDKTFYLIGDAGLSPLGGMSNGLIAFKKHIERKPTDGDYAVFLGDNIYPDGLPGEGQRGRTDAVNHLTAQVNSVEGFEGTTIFIPGNHDWYSNGPEGLKAEEKFIEDALGDDTFQPENGCPLESVDVSETIQLIIIDTQWYMENWNRHPTINDECEIKTRERFFEELEGELKKAQNKTIVFAMHHPMYTNGVHGGYYSLGKHLYPTQKKIPVPILSSLATQIRTQGGVSIQDRFNESYNDLMNRLETMTLDTENLVFVSGHEHTLQYIENEKVRQIVSGSGSKESFAALGENGVFSYGKQGFAKLTIYKDGSSWVSMFGEENGEPKLLFQKEVFKPTEPYDVSDLPDEFPGEVEVSIYTNEETDKTDFFKSIWGDHYRKVYSTPIKAKVATLDTLYGGLEVVRAGGGHQTKSLRLKTKDGKELNMRALRKSATQYLKKVLFKDTYIQDEFEKTAVQSLILDFYTAAHPYAFTVVPDLSNAAMLYHTNPRIYYIPKHKYLGKYNAEYGGELYMIEERPEDAYSKERNFGYADDIESTHDIIEKVREDEKYKIDINAYVRARLFDMLIGDWDRHQDQWRWAQFDQENGDKWYRPIPRDRDQVFSNFDGKLLDVMRVIAGSANQLQVYDDELKNIEWMNAAGIKLDRILAQEATRDMWLEQAKFLQENITDAVIDKAFLKVPKAVQDSTLLEIKKNLKGRRGHMLDIAERYYKHLNELVILTGTDKDDYIEITRTNDKETNVKMYRIIDGGKGELFVDKTFNRDITKEMWIYGLDDDDVFKVSGKSNNLIFIRIIGGQNNDVYDIRDGRRIKIYDHESKPNTIINKGGAIIRFTDVYNLNLFDYTKNIVSGGGITPTGGYNPDDGVYLGLEYISSTKGFQRNPFSQEHRFKTNYDFATSGISLDYDGEFANIMNDWNLHVGGRLTSSNFAMNFFGLGNETDNLDDDLGMDYNRVRTSIYMGKAGILKKGRFGSDYGFRGMLEGIKIDDTDGRFIAEGFLGNTDEDFFERRYFGALEAEYSYNSYDRKINPTRGMRFLLLAGARTEFKNSKHTYGYVNSHLGFYNGLTKDRKLVLKTDARAQFRIGDDYTFFQAATIGAENGLRGYRNERFTGHNSFVTSADLRYSFEPLRTRTLPLQFGIYTGFDLGRVWLKQDHSDKWHNDYGGGFWVTAAESLSANFNLFNSSEGSRFSFGLGLNF